ncbi:MAG: MG2 domain-containing protein, partial [Thermoguttaceae bacterium]
MLISDGHVLEFVDAYLHDALSKPDTERVRRHCEKCPICKVALEEAQKRFAAMGALPAVEASEKLIRATQARIAQAPRIKLTVVHYASMVAAMAVAIVAMANIYYLTLSPSPYDLRVLGQNELIAGSEVSLRVLLVDHRDGRPLEGVPVDVELLGNGTKSPFHLASFTTDRFGSAAPRLQLPEWEDGDYQLRVTARPGGSSETITRPLRLKRSWRLMLTTDKPVYQPGQTIRLRSLGLRRPDSKPVAGEEIVFSVSDPKGNVIFRRRDVTSRFGIASMDCPLANEIITGPYRVQCEVGDTSSEVTVEVKKYVLPKFKIDVKLDKPYYQPAQRVRGTVDVRYFFGKPAQDAEVNIDVRTMIAGPTTIHTATVRTDADGKATFEFQLPEMLVGREQHEGDARVSIDVTVRDSAGQEQSTSVKRIVTAEPIHVEVIPEGGTLVRGLANNVYILA